MKKTGKAGRPKLPKGEAKSAMIRARFTPMERARIVSAAKRAGMELSNWTRKTLLDAS